MEGLYSVHVKIRYLHDKTYEKGPKWYRSWNDRSYSRSIHKAVLSTYIISFIVFSIGQSLFPYLFNPAKPQTVNAGADTKTWTTRGDFNNGTTKSNVTITGSQDSDNANVTLPSTQQLQLKKYGQQIRDVIFVDANNGYACSDVGDIFKTTDAGGSWFPQKSNTTNGLYAAHFTSLTNGVMVGVSGTTVRTTDGGTTWAVVSVSTGGQNFNDVYFTDADTGYAVGGGGIIYKTTNAGASWSAQTSGVVNGLNGIHFVDASTGFISGNSIILKTTNGGANWTTVDTYAATEYAVYFKDANNGFVVGGTSTIRKTTDGGSTWSNQNVPAGTYFSIKFLDSTVGYAGAMNGQMIKTVDGGANWSDLTSESYTSNNIWGISIIDASTVYISGQNGAMLKTTNGGSTWSSLFTSGTSSAFNTIHFPTQSIGYAGGASGMIVKSTDGGNSWVTQTSGTTYAINDIYFSSANNGIAVASSGRIRRTTDGGATWNTSTSGTTQTLTSVQFLDSNTGYVAGYYGAVLKTTNGGSSWSVLSGTSTADFYSMFFTDVNTGYIFATATTSRKTTDGGQTWNLLPNTGGAGLHYGTYFTDANTGYIVGEAGSIRKTIDGGNTWSSLNSGVGVTLNEVFFVNSNVGYAAGNSGVILKTVDAGVNWASIGGGNNPNYGLHATDADTVLIGSLHSTIFKLLPTYTSPGSISALKFDAQKVVKWGNISWTGGSLPADTTIKLRTRGASTEGGLSSATWDGTGVGSGYITFDVDGHTTDSAAISTPLNIWMEVELTLESTNSSNSPNIDNIAVTYDALENPSNSNLTLTRTTGSDPENRLYNSTGNHVTAGTAGAYTNESALKVTATGLTCTDCGTSTNIRPEVEVKQTGTSFTGTGTVTAEPGNDYAIITGLTAGTDYHAQIRAIDDQGRISGWTSYGNNAENAADFTVEQTAPTGTISINSGATYATQTTVTLDLSASDAGGSNLSKMRFSNNGINWGSATNDDGSISNTNWVNYSASLPGWDIPTGDGEKTVYAQFKDNAGNVSNQELDTATANFNGTFDSILPGQNFLEMQKVVDLGTGLDGELIVDGTTAGASTLAGVVISDGGYTGPFDATHPLVLDTVIARTNRVYNFTNLILQNSAVVTHTATIGAFTGYEGITVKANGNISIDASSSINLDGKGYNDNTVKGPGTSTESGSTYTYGGTGGGVRV